MIRREFRKSNLFYQYFGNILLEADNEFLRSTFRNNIRVLTIIFLKRFGKFDIPCKE